MVGSNWLHGCAVSIPKCRSELVSDGAGGWEWGACLLVGAQRMLGLLWAQSHVSSSALVRAHVLGQLCETGSGWGGLVCGLGGDQHCIAQVKNSCPATECPLGAMTPGRAHPSRAVAVGALVPFWFVV
eukprot:1159736-Pelagomonas_calceolata.AAC.9